MFGRLLAHVRLSNSRYDWFFGVESVGMLCTELWHVIGSAAHMIPTDPAGPWNKLKESAGVIRGEISV